MNLSYVHKAHGWYKWWRKNRNSGSKCGLAFTVQRKKESLFYGPFSVLAYEWLNGIFFFMPYLGTNANQ